MQVNVSRNNYEEKIKEAIEVVKEDKNTKKKAKNHIREYGVTGGFLQKIIHDPDEMLPNLEMELLLLVGESIYLSSGYKNLRTENFFTENEIKLAHQYTPAEENTLELPITFENVLRVNSESYITTIDVHKLQKMYDSQLLRYNFDTQREARWTQDSSGSIQKKIKIHEKSVKEISNHLLNGTLKSTKLVFNCLAGTSDEDDEIIYDSKKQTLTITEGTMIDIIDGFHRMGGTLRALQQNPEISFTFELSIKNLTTKGAQQEVAQLNTINEMSAGRLREMKEERYSDTVAKQLQTQGELVGKVSQGSRVYYAKPQVVTFATLAEAIDEAFNPESKKEAYKIADYLTEFFDMLIDEYPDYFNGDQTQNAQKTLINSNVMMYGFVFLAKKAQDEGIGILDTVEFINSMSFSRDSEYWRDRNVVDGRGNVTTNAKGTIKNYFKNADFNTVAN